MIAEGLCLEPEEIRPESRFFADLDGESIELLELSFQCGKHFGIDPQFQKLLPASELEIDAQNRLTPAAIELVKERAPYLDLSAFEQNPKLDHVSDLITVGAICECMRRLMRQRETAVGGQAMPAI